MNSMYAVTLAAMLMVVGYAADARAQLPLLEFRNNHYLGHCIEVRNGSTKPGARVQHGPCNSSLHQLFSFVPSDMHDGTVKIQAHHSNMCLQVAESTRDQGYLVLVQATCLTGKRNQDFRIIRYEEPGYEHLRWIQATPVGKPPKKPKCVAANARYIVQRTISPNNDQLWLGFEIP